MKNLREKFYTAAAVAAFAVVGLGYAVAEKITGREITSDMKLGF